MCARGVNVKERAGERIERGRLRWRSLDPGRTPAMKGGDPSGEEGQTGQARAAWMCEPSDGCAQQAWAKHAWWVRWPQGRKSHWVLAALPIW